MSNTKNISPETWEVSVLKALRRLGPDALHHLSRINAIVAQIRREAGLPTSRTYEATVRRVLQQSKQVRHGKPGFWGLALDRDS